MRLQPIGCRGHRSSAVAGSATISRDLAADEFGGERISFKIRYEIGERGQEGKAANAPSLFERGLTLVSGRCPTVVGFGAPAARRLIEVRPRHAGVEPQAVAQAEPVRDVIGIAKQLGL